MATLVDFNQARAMAVQLVHGADPDLQNLAFAFLQLFREKTDTAPDSRHADHVKWLDMALQTVKEGSARHYSAAEIQRSARENDWPGVSIMMAYNAGASQSD